MNVVTKSRRRRSCSLAVLMAWLLLSKPLLGIANDGSTHMSLHLTSPETLLLKSPPCPPVMPWRPSSLNPYLENAGEKAITCTTLKFTLAVDDQLHYLGIEPKISKETFILEPHGTRSLGLGFMDLQFQDENGVALVQSQVLDALARGKWSISASILCTSATKSPGEYNPPVSSNSLEFPLSREACEHGISCSLGEPLPRLEGLTH